MDEAELQRLRERVDLLEAERAIAHVMYRYIEACDVLKNASYIASLFTEDAIWEGRGNLAEFGQTIGRTAIREMFVENPQMLPFTAHFLCNPTIVVAPDVSRGWGKWHVLEAATLRDKRAQVWMLAWYDNDFRRVDDTWKISHVRYQDTCVVPYEQGWLKTTYVSPLTFKTTASL